MNTAHIDMSGLVAIEPKKDCPHVLEEELKTPAELLDLCRKVTDPCSQCGIPGEVWICLTCGEIFCSRYVQGHMSLHNAESGHPIAFSFADFSYWCYTCDSYIVNPTKLCYHSKDIPAGFYD